MKNWINKIGKDKFQRYLFIGVLILVFGVFFISLSLLDTKEKPDIKDPNTELPDDENPDDEKPVVYEVIKAPYANENYEVVKKYWSKTLSTEEQVASLVRTGSNYTFSKGISIASKDNKDQVFDVVASLSGKVIKVVKNDALFENYVKIEHDNGLVSVYNSLSEIKVAEGADVKQGDVIGVSGIAEYDQDMEHKHVHFQLLLNGSYVDPLKLIGKKINEIE